MDALPVLFLLGSLFSCSHANSDTSAVEGLKQAALQWQGPLTCDTWDCNCTFTRQRGCCCAAQDLFQVEDRTGDRLAILWHNIIELLSTVKAYTENTKIAFKATMMQGQVLQKNCFGPYSDSVPLPFANVTLNDNNAYNPAWGIFTAPHRGVYVFSFTVYSHVEQSERLFHKVILMWNGEEVVSVWESNRDDEEDSATQMAILELQVGDQVYLKLEKGRRLCKHLEYNIFTGYMLYPHNEIPSFADY